MKNNGTSQLDRIPRAASDYFVLDEMAFEQLLAIAVDYTEILHFHSPGNTTELGTEHGRNPWEDIFLSDELPIIAQILTINLTKYDAEFRHTLAALQRNHFEIPEHFDPNTLPSYRLARKLNEWLIRLRAIDGEVPQSLKRQLQDFIHPELTNELCALSEYLNIPDLIRRDFDDIWISDQLGVVTGQFKEMSGEAIELFFRGNFHAFYKALSLLKNAATLLAPSSFGSKQHSPAVGLFMTFLKLYNKVQGSINSFTERHLDYYYKDILKFLPRQADADGTYLLLGQDSSKSHILVHKGTKFSAGVDKQNREIIFTADNDVLIGKTQIAELYTLYFERNPIIFPERLSGFVTSGKINRIPVPKHFTIQSPQKAWPLLGAPKEKTQSLTSTDVEIGFALTSPILLLQDGKRELTFGFDFVRDDLESDGDDRGCDVFGEWLSTIAGKTDVGVRNNLRDAGIYVDADTFSVTFEELHKQDLFYKIFREMFRVSLTTENGWYQVKEYLPLSNAIASNDVNHSLIIQIQLAAEDAPITPYNPAVHGRGYDTRHPIVRFQINPNNYLYPYSLLTKMNVRSIDIDVAVKGLKNILIYNHLGQLDAKTAFNPFGPLPAIGSYFLIGSAEAAQKHLTDLEVNIEWGDLPTGDAGFSEHYAGYTASYNNSSFEVNIKTLTGGEWLPINDAELHREKLFISQQKGPESGVTRKIARHRMLSCQSVVTISAPSNQVLQDKAYVYDPETKNGFFRFTLCSPVQAFGHKAYPSLLSKVLTENARLKKIKLAKPTPNAPYTPLIESIDLNYRAGVTINMNRANLAGGTRKHEKMFHIHPFGTDHISPQTHRYIKLLPDDNSAGNLFIGLRGDSLVGELSLLFQLREDSIASYARQPSIPAWSYLSATGWQPLENFRILKDGTSGFKRSGIVVLNLPADISRGNEIMPPDYAWLKVSVQEHPELLCSAYAIYAQALRISRYQSEDEQIGSFESIPAQQIKSSLTSIPGITQILQPVSSFGGKRMESMQQLKMRAGERLRHKQRAVVNWDYERLILERFPEIFLVKCFSNMASKRIGDERAGPGSLLIVVVPNLDHSGARHLQPLADINLLQDIHKYVRAIASPFARIEVRNPDYEQIQIRCSVKFKTKASGDDLVTLYQAIITYLSPWEADGYHTFFDWCIRSHDVESYIHNLNYIDYVTGFSMLRISSQSDEHYSLTDTVKRSGEVLQELRPIQPWSIAVPVTQHHIQIIDKESYLAPSRTGTNDLEIGTTFII